MSELSRLPALVLTAGLATRLQPLSDVRAKAALPVAGTPLITRILRWLQGAGIRRVVLNLHHRAPSITSIVGDGSTLGLDVRYSWETQVLGSAGGPARAIPLLESDRFLIVNGDTLADVDLNAVAQQHIDTNALVTMAVVNGRPEYNGVIAEPNGIVRGFGRAPGAFHFIGVQVVNASVFAGVDPDVKSETVHGIYPSLIAARPEAVRIFHTGAEFFDIGSPRDYLDTALTIARREGRPIDRGIDCEVAADAQLDDTILWDRVSIGAGAGLSNCVVADGVGVPAGAKYSHSCLVMRDNRVVAAPFDGTQARTISR
jgi:NDP-sugar pyrophosphorylase family protein